MNERKCVVNANLKTMAGHISIEPCLCINVQSKMNKTIQTQNVNMQVQLV